MPPPKKEKTTQQKFSGMKRKLEKIVHELDDVIDELQEEEKQTLQDILHTLKNMIDK